MTLDSSSELRLAQVNPVLAGRIRQMAQVLAEEGITIRVTQGLRSMAQQQELWQEGRDQQGNVVDRSKVVTDAPPGTSWHNFGLAVDVVPMEDDSPDWDVNHPVWARIVAVGESLGLTSGSTWRTFPDWPHFQISGKLPTDPDDNVRAIAKASGIDAVWTAAQIA